MTTTADTRYRCLIVLLALWMALAAAAGCSRRQPQAPERAGTATNKPPTTSAARGAPSGTRHAAQPAPACTASFDLAKVERATRGLGLIEDLLVRIKDGEILADDELRRLVAAPNGQKKIQELMRDTYFSLSVSGAALYVSYLEMARDSLSNELGYHVYAGKLADAYAHYATTANQAKLESLADSLEIPQREDYPSELAYWNAEAGYRWTLEKAADTKYGNPYGAIQYYMLAATTEYQAHLRPFYYAAELYAGMKRYDLALVTLDRLLTLPPELKYCCTMQPDGKPVCEEAKALVKWDSDMVIRDAGQLRDKVIQLQAGCERNRDRR